MTRRKELLSIAEWLERIAAAEIDLGPVTMRALARDLESIAARDAWAPHALIALAIVAGFCGGLLWHAYVP